MAFQINIYDPKAPQEHVSIPVFPECGMTKSSTSSASSEQSSSVFIHECPTVVWIEAKFDKAKSSSTSLFWMCDDHRLQFHYRNGNVANIAFWIQSFVAP
jgi:hypothetical protein